MSNIITDMGIGLYRGLSKKQMIQLIDILNDTLNISIPSDSELDEIINIIKNLTLGNASLEDVLIGNTFSNNDGLNLQGTMPSFASPKIPAGVRDSDNYKYIKIDKGAYLSEGDSGLPEIQISPSQFDSNIKSENLKANISICNIKGKSTVVDTENGDAGEDDILLNKKAYVNGKLITGKATMKSIIENELTSFGGIYLNLNKINDSINFFNILDYYIKNTKLVFFKYINDEDGIQLIDIENNSAKNLSTEGYYNSYDSYKPVYLDDNYLKIIGSYAYDEPGMVFIHDISNNTYEEYPINLNLGGLTNSDNYRSNRSTFSDSLNRNYSIFTKGSSSGEFLLVCFDNSSTIYYKELIFNNESFYNDLFQAFIYNDKIYMITYSGGIAIINKSNGNIEQQININININNIDEIKNDIFVYTLYGDVNTFYIYDISSQGLISSFTLPSYAYESMTHNINNKRYIAINPETKMIYFRYYDTSDILNPETNDEKLPILARKGITVMNYETNETISINPYMFGMNFFILDIIGENLIFYYMDDESAIHYSYFLLGKINVSVLF